MREKQDKNKHYVTTIGLIIQHRRQNKLSTHICKSDGGPDADIEHMRKQETADRRAASNSGKSKAAHFPAVVEEA